MKPNKAIRCVLLFNLILSLFIRSTALNCFTKAVFSKNEDFDETLLLDGAETVDCADDETNCITVSGSFAIDQGAQYVIRKLRKCASTDLCEGKIDENSLAELLKTFDATIKTDNIRPWNVATTSSCCQQEYCNKLADEVLPTTAPSSGYKNNFSSIHSFFALSLIFWFF